MATVAGYLENFGPVERKHFERVKRIVLKTVPEAEETMSYGIPTFKYKGKYLIYFAAYKNHMSLYPYLSEVEGVGGKLDKYKSGRGTLRFSDDDPIPEPLIGAIVKHRKQSIDQGKKDY